MTRYPSYKLKLRYLHSRDLHSRDLHSRENMSHHGNYCNTVLVYDANGTSRFTLSTISQSIGDADRWESIASHFYAWVISGVFAWAAIGLSVHLIVQHCRHYYKPILQRHMTRILCMVGHKPAIAHLTLRVTHGLVSLIHFQGPNIQSHVVAHLSLL